MALSILKINEPILIQRGRDDEAFVNIIKDFFKRLDDSFEDDGMEESGLKGPKLVLLLKTTMYFHFAPLITTDVMDHYRFHHRLKVVHEMENTNRKVQVRNLSEQSTVKVLG